MAFLIDLSLESWNLGKVRTGVQWEGVGIIRIDSEFILVILVFY